MADKFETRLFINGEFVESRSNARASVYSPTDNSLVTDGVHVALDHDIDAAVVAARRAQPSWAAQPAIARAKILLKVADLIEQYAQDFARLEAMCTGKPVSAAGYESALAANTFRYYAGYIDKLSGKAYPADTGFVRIVNREPIGVCAAVNAFNGPLIMLAFKAAPALAAGNSIIIKASEKSPLSSLVFGKLANEAGIPPGVLNLVNGDGRTGALLASHMDIDKIAFTGSAGTGKKIAQVAASSNLKKVSLELGGKSPSIVFPDANLENAIKWCVQGITANTGQACIASSRVYVHADVKEAFVNGMKQAFESLDGVTGADLHDPGTMIGPLVDKLQHDRVAEYVKTGKSEATLVTGGDTMHGGKGCWIRPALFVDPKPGATIYQEEIFGPVVVVSEFTDEEDVIERANATPFGLSGAVFSQDINRALGVSRKIHSGTVGINCCMMIDHTVAFGGMKQSGWGRELGKDGLLAYTEAKTTFINMTY